MKFAETARFGAQTKPAYTPISENCDWVAFSFSGGSGSSTLQYNVTANTLSASRTCQVIIGGNTFTITQAAATCTTPVAEMSVASGSAGNAPFTVDFVDASSNNPTQWLWLFHGANPSTSTDQNPKGIVYANCGYFNVTLSATNACGSNQKTVPGIIYVICTGIKESLGIESIQVFPNPNNGTFEVRFSSALPMNLNVDIVNTVGQTVFKSSADTGTSSLHVDGLLSGIYYINIRSEKGAYVQKVLVQ
jgi:PKD repeat protein